MRPREDELPEQLLVIASRTPEIRAAARQARQAAVETRSHAQSMRGQSEMLRQAASELREQVFAYASTLHDLGRSAASAIESARDIADNALRDVRPTVHIDRSERDEIEGEIVLWTIDAYLAA